MGEDQDDRGRRLARKPPDRRRRRDLLTAVHAVVHRLASRLSLFTDEVDANTRSPELSRRRSVTVRRASNRRSREQKYKMGRLLSFLRLHSALLSGYHQGLETSIIFVFCKVSWLDICQSGGKSSVLSESSFKMKR